MSVVYFPYMKYNLYWVSQVLNEHIMTNYTNLWYTYTHNGIGKHPQILQCDPFSYSFHEIKLLIIVLYGGIGTCQRWKINRRKLNGNNFMCCGISGNL